MSSSVSLVKTLNSIVDKKINATQQKTTPKILLYIMGSTLTPIDLETVSH